MMHCCRAFELALDKEGCDIFRRFSNAEFAQVGAVRSVCRS